LKGSPRGQHYIVDVALAERPSPMAAAKGRRLCRAGIRAFAQKLKKDFSADGDNIETEVCLLQIVLKF